MQTIFDEIISIEEIDEEYTLDIETDGDHLFFANNILTHNSAVSATVHNHAQIAGGISKIHEADTYWSIIMTDEMKAMGKVIFILQKTRNSDGVGTQVHLKWDAKYLRIIDEEDGDYEPLIFKKKESETEEQTGVKEQTGDKLTGMLSSIL